MNDYLKNSLKQSIKYMHYWIERAIDDVKNKDSAHTALRFALGYAHDLDVTMYRFQDRIDETINWEELVKEAKDEAWKELEKENERIEKD